MVPPWRAGFLESLARWGVLRSDTVRDALARLDDAVLLRHGRGGLYAPSAEGAQPEFSPRLSVFLAELLDLRPGLRVALPPAGCGFLTQVATSAGGDAHKATPEAPADRALVLEKDPLPPLAPQGFALRLSLEPYYEALSKVIPTEDGEATLKLEGLPLHGNDPKGRPVRQLLVVEGFCRRALADSVRSPDDEQFAHAVQSTWRPPAGAEAANVDSARRLFHLAYIHMFTADLGDAIELYRASLEAHRTAEAHTFLGWALSFTGDFAKAIVECEQAIKIDAGFGNPYNDIGAYLLEMKRPGDALPWFARALSAPRYDAPHFAHCNAGRALMELGQLQQARDAFKKALDVQPDYRPAKDFLNRLP